MPNDTDLAAARDDARAAVARALRAPARVPLTEFGVIAVSGTDAVGFLQSQLTSDVSQLGAGGMQLSGYCTAKGRLLATFHQWRHGDDILLRLPSELLPGVLKRLSMFVLRAKAKLVDASAQWSTDGLLAPDAADIDRRAAATLPADPWNGTMLGDVRMDRVPGTEALPSRWLLTRPAAAALPAWCAELPELPAEAWWWSEIEAAVPTVFAATQEKFVPQMINFEVLGGVNFRKGCYPGQEVVARSQYLGKLKRRMQRGHVDGADVAMGADVFHSAGEQPVGTVVMAAPAPRGGTDLLFEVPIDRLESGTLYAGGANGAPITVRSLPYALFDPTA